LYNNIAILDENQNLYLHGSDSVKSNIKAKFVASTYHAIFAIGLDDMVWYGRCSHFIQTVIKSTQISCGNSHAIIIGEDDYLWVHGTNCYGRLEIGDVFDDLVLTKTDNKAKFVSCGKYHTAILDENNDLWMCGNNSKGQLGLGHTDDVNVFTKVPIEVKTVRCENNYTMVTDRYNNILACGAKKDLGFDACVFTKIGFKAVGGSRYQRTKSARK
jgi:alpha-tubulin suppressor-like RCC1 family protein